MKDENRARLEALLDEEVSGPLGDKIMNLVDDIVDDECRLTLLSVVDELATALEGVHIGNFDDPVHGVYRCGKADGYLEAAGTVRHHYDERTSVSGHHRRLLTLTADEVDSLIASALGGQGACDDPDLRSALHKLEVK